MPFTTKITSTFLKLLALLTVVGCSGNPEPETEVATSGSVFCANQMALISSFDTLPARNLNLFYAHDSLDVLISQLYDSTSCCEQVYFNLPFSTGTAESIKVTVNAFHDCGECPLPIRAINYHSVLLNSRGQLLVEDQFMNMEQLAESVSDYYISLDTNDEGNWSKSAQIDFFWDSEVNELAWRMAIVEILKGYLNFVEEKSLVQYKRGICELSENELTELDLSISFHLIISRKMTPPLVIPEIVRI